MILLDETDISGLICGLEDQPDVMIVLFTEGRFFGRTTRCNNRLLGWFLRFAAE